MPNLVNIPAASVEYVGRFERPCIRLIANWSDTLQAVIDVLLPFGFELSNMDLTAGRPVEHKASFRLPERNCAFHFTAESISFNKDGADWGTAANDLELLRAVEQAVLINAGARLASRTITLSMHLQFLDKPREEIISEFFAEFFRAGSGEYKPIQHGAFLKWESGNVLFDNSVAYANGLFVRMQSVAPFSRPLEYAMEKLRRDEAFVFSLVNAEEADGAA